MNLEEVKNDLDIFMREIFHGFSTFSFARFDEKLTPLHIGVIKGLSGGDLKSENNFLIQISEMFDNYRENKLDEEKIKVLYSLISRLRSFGIIIHNNDAVSNLKMEKLNADDKSHRLEKENELLAEELSRCRSTLDSKKAAMEAIK
ncbi:MAG: hypothetical protein KGH87_05520 [Thaumarchaeota archaeon]|nr:hypothetical protein [Nitrososphaerota archaeon]